MVVMIITLMIIMVMIITMTMTVNVNELYGIVQIQALFQRLMELVSSSK